MRETESHQKEQRDRNRPRSTSGVEVDVAADDRRWADIFSVLVSPAHPGSGGQGGWAREAAPLLLNPQRASTDGRIKRPLQGRPEDEGKPEASGQPPPIRHHRILHRRVTKGDRHVTSPIRIPHRVPVCVAGLGRILGGGRRPGCGPTRLPRGEGPRG